MLQSTTTTTCTLDDDVLEKEINETRRSEHVTESGTRHGRRVGTAFLPSRAADTVELHAARTERSTRRERSVTRDRCCPTTCDVCR